MKQSKGPIYKPEQLQPYDFFTKMPSIHNEEKTASSTTGIKNTGYPYMEKMKQDLYLLPCTPIPGPVKWLMK